MAFLNFETELLDCSLDVYFPFESPMESLSAEELFDMFPACGEVATSQRTEENFQNALTDSLAMSICKAAEPQATVPMHDEVFQESAGADQCPPSEVHVAHVDATRENCSNSWLVYDEKYGRERRPFLHEFIRMLLDNEEYSHIAGYVDRKRGIFKLFSTTGISQLWKKVKGRNSNSKMSYDKLARAIRYYYPTGIMQSHPGRYTFRFGPKSGFGVDWFPGDLVSSNLKTLQKNNACFIS